eukprot:gene10250-11952_t
MHRLTSCVTRCTVSYGPGLARNTQSFVALVPRHHSLTRLANGGSQLVQARYGFWSDFVGNFRQIVDETPEYRKTFDDFQNRFPYFKSKPKPQVDDQQQQQQDMGQQQQQQEQEMGQQQQQQEQEEKVELDENGKPKEKVYASKEEELRDKYKEYYKDYDKRKAEAESMSMFKGDMTPEQAEQLMAAYKETLGVRPPFPPYEPRNYTGVSDLREMAFRERMRLPLEYQPLIDIGDLLPDTLEAEDNKHIPTIIALLKAKEIELRAQGVECPEVDWDSFTQIEQFEDVPDVYKQAFDLTEEELALEEEKKLPIPIVRDALWHRRENQNKWLDRAVALAERLPSLGGNLFYYYLARAASVFNGQGIVFSGPTALTKFYMDNKDLVMPGFELHKYIAVCREMFIPEFLELYLCGNEDELESFCSETGHKIIKGLIAARSVGHKVLDGKFVSLENFEHEILSTPMVIALSVDIDANDFGYVVQQIVVHLLYTTMMEPLTLTAMPGKEVPISQGRFEAYVDNGGTVLAIAGETYCVVAGDTRMSDGGYGIQTRKYTKIFKLTDKCVIATSGMQADTIALRKVLDISLRKYEKEHGKPMSTPAISQFLSNTLYHKRFFPYYTFNLVAGIDDEGVGCVWTYDAVGSHERVKWSSQGSGNQLVQPLLDNQVGKYNQQILVGPKELSEAQAEALAKDSITSAGERDIYTGDSADIVVINQTGVTFKKFELKQD